MTTGTRRKVLRLLISTLKGGPGKTTTSFFLALAFARMGRRVVLICADPKSQGSRDWYRRATALAQLGMGEALPFTLAEWNSNEESGRPAAFAKRQEQLHPDADVIIVDTGGESPDVFGSAALWANYAVVPVGAQRGELARMFATFDAAAEVAEASNLVISALLTRVLDPKRGSARDAREFLDGTVRLAELEADPEKEEKDCEGMDMHVLDTEIKFHKGRYGDVYGTNPDDLGAYAALAVEIDAMEIAA